MSDKQIELMPKNRRIYSKFCSKICLNFSSNRTESTEIESNSHKSYHLLWSELWSLASNLRLTTEDIASTDDNNSWLPRHQFKCLPNTNLIVIQLLSETQTSVLINTLIQRYCYQSIGYLLSIEWKKLSYIWYNYCQCLAKLRSDPKTRLIYDEWGKQYKKYVWKCPGYKIELSW